MKKETFCLVCKNYTKNTNPKIVRNRQNRLMIQSNSEKCLYVLIMSRTHSRVNPHSIVA